MAVNAEAVMRAALKQAIDGVSGQFDYLGGVHAGTCDGGYIIVRRKMATEFTCYAEEKFRGAVEAQIPVFLLPPTGCRNASDRCNELLDGGYQDKHSVNIVSCGGIESYYRGQIQCSGNQIRMFCDGMEVKTRQDDPFREVPEVAALICDPPTSENFDEIEIRGPPVRVVVDISSRAVVVCREKDKQIVYEWSREQNLWLPKTYFAKDAPSDSGDSSSD